MKYCTQFEIEFRTLCITYYYFFFIYYDFNLLFNLLCTLIFLLELELDFKLVISICFPPFLLLRVVEELNK